MEVKDFAWKLKALEDSGRFEGLAAVYGVEDLQGDVIEKGAFTRAISQQPAAGFPLLWAHDQAVPVGLAKLVDGDKGPVVHGEIDRGDVDGERAFQRAKKGVVRGLSIGFSLPNGDAVKYHGSTRHIHELRLHEVSLVAIPAQPGAMILTVKTLGDAARLLDKFPVDRMGAAEVEALEVIQKHVGRLLSASTTTAPDPALLNDLRDLARLVRLN
jgi:uncharacterized protein